MRIPARLPRHLLPAVTRLIGRYLVSVNHEATIGSYLAQSLSESLLRSSGSMSTPTTTKRPTAFAEKQTMEDPIMISWHDTQSAPANVTSGLFVLTAYMQGYPLTELCITASSMRSTYGYLAPFALLASSCPRRAYLEEILGSDD